MTSTAGDEPGRGCRLGVKYCSTTGKPLSRELGEYVLHV